MSRTSLFLCAFLCIPCNVHTGRIEEGSCGCDTECHIVFFDMEWNDVTEECIWQFLVHEEFKVWDVHRGLTCPCTQESLRCLGHALPTRTQACHGLASVVRAVAISMAMSVFSRS